MISSRHWAHWLAVTLVTDASSISAFLKLPDRQGNAVTSGTASDIAKSAMTGMLLFDANQRIASQQAIH